MPLARASELDRLLACPGSTILPRSDVKSERVQEAADYGTLVHHWKETGDPGTGRLSTTLKKKLKEAGVTRERWSTEGLHEVPLAFNVVTTEARALVLPLSSTVKDEWKAAFGPDWVVGTADYIGTIMDAPWVDDLKTGRQVTWRDHE